MSLVINTNSSATVASTNLRSSNAMLQKSLNRLSSGKKIVSPADDAGGLAVSMKLTAALKRTDAVNTNLANAVSFLQSQEGGLSTASKLLDRMGELRTLYGDVTKSPSDQANYNAEFIELQAQLTNIASETFNGIALFGGGTLSVPSSEDGTQTITIDQSDIATGVAAITAAADLSAITIADVTTAIQNVADVLATNGAQSSRMLFASDMLTINRTNLEAANSRIIDTDVAIESTQFARYNILVQSGAAMLAQANAGTQVALRLLN